MKTSDEEVNQAIHKIVEPDGCWHERFFSEDGEGCLHCGTRPLPLNPDYTTDLNAVAKAVEHCRKLWLEQDALRTQYFRFTDVCDLGWRVDIDWPHHDGEISVAIARDQSLPKAICLAIIAALDALPKQTGGENDAL